MFYCAVCNAIQGAVLRCLVFVKSSSVTIRLKTIIFSTLFWLTGYCSLSHCAGVDKLHLVNDLDAW